MLAQPDRPWIDLGAGSTGIKARLSARVTNGAIKADGLDVAVSEQSRRRLDGTIGGGGPLIRLQTTNGAVQIRGK